MQRTPFWSERIQMIDPRTGIKVIQITSYPTPAANLIYLSPCVTPDNRRLVFFCQRSSRRDAPWDLYRCDTDGLNFFQLTERGDRAEKRGDYGRPPAVLARDGSAVYVVWDNRLHSVEMETGRTEEVADLGAGRLEDEGIGYLYLSDDGRTLYTTRLGPTRPAVRVNLATGAVDEPDFGGGIGGCFPSTSRLLVSRARIEWGTVENPDGSRRITNVGTEPEIWSVDPDGGDPRFITKWMFAHMTILPGKAPRVQGTGKPPDSCIWTVEEGKEPVKLIEGPYCWHSAPSRDGEWIVADTNWPNRGLVLVHVPTGHWRTLCDSRATSDHVDSGHPHPNPSPDGRIVVFRSDRTGVPQVYVAHVSDEFRESVIAGELDRPRDKWI